MRRLVPPISEGGGKQVEIGLDIAAGAAAPMPTCIHGHESRIGQVINNLHRQCALLRAGQGRTHQHRHAPGGRGASRSSSRTTARASAPKRSSAFSSASTPTGRTSEAFRPEFRPRPVDLTPDHRGPWRHDHRRKPGTARRLGARFIVALPASKARRLKSDRS